MRWNHQLLKRFNSTSHFRLLNQVRSELKANPIVREHFTTSKIQDTYDAKVHPQNSGN